MRSLGLAAILWLLVSTGAPGAQAQIDPSPEVPHDPVLPLFIDEVGFGTPALTFPEMIQACRGTNTSPERLAACQEGALTAVAGRSLLGLSASAGGPTPGSSSTLGKRVGRISRLSFSVRGRAVRGPLPRIGSETTGPGRETTVTVPSLEVGASASLLDGFSLTPNAGGVLSLDLLATGHWVGGPSSAGFSGDLMGWGVGGRLGLLRESFTLPGITLSYSYRSMGEGRMGELSAGDRVEAVFDVTLQSLRMVVGKDLMGMGVLAGIGQDRSTGSARFSLAGSSPGQVLGSASDELATNRRVYFLGVSRTYLILQFSGELGWAGGHDLDLPHGSATDFDLGSRSWFGSLACRLTF